MPVDPARLRPISLFDDLTDADVASIGAKMEERVVEPGEHLAREGSTGYFFFVILDGRAQVDRHGETIAELGPGNFFGEAAVLEATRRNATVTATTPMVVGAMFGADFAKLASDSPELHARISHVMSTRRVVET